MIGGTFDELQMVRLALTALDQRLRTEGRGRPFVLEELLSQLATVRGRPEPPPMDGNAESPEDADVLLLTYPEAARRLSVSVRTVERKVQAGELPARGMGRSARIHRNDLQAYADGLPARTAPDRTTA